MEIIPLDRMPRSSTMRVPRSKNNRSFFVSSPNRRGMVSQPLILIRPLEAARGDSASIVDNSNAMNLRE